jgi:hypothetical protein
MNGALKLLSSDDEHTRQTDTGDRVFATRSTTASFPFSPFIHKDYNVSELLAHDPFVPRHPPDVIVADHLAHL